MPDDPEKPLRLVYGTFYNAIYRWICDFLRVHQFLKTNIEYRNDTQDSHEDSEIHM